MRTLAILTCLLLAWASPASAQGFDKDKLEEIIEKATEKPKKKKAKKTSSKVKAKKPKSDRVHAKEMRKLLRKRKATVDFVKTPFTKVLEFLRTKSGLKIVLTKKAKKKHGKTVVTLRQKETITLRVCLDEALELVSKEDLRCGVKDGAIWIGLEAEAKKAKLTKL